MRILAIGDIVGSPGRNAVKTLVPKIKKEEGVDFVVANAENAAGGSGITPDIAEEIFGYGVDVITSGDHIWKKKEIYDILDKESRILRPANYPDGVPGMGSTVIKSKTGVSVGVINLIGRVFMDAVDCPFKAAKKEIERIKKETNIIIIDMHAEATSEKIALVWYLDGIASFVFGTHTHIQTADERIYPKATAYITDLGMTGPYDSVIGRQPEQIIERFILQIPTKFLMAENNIQLHGAIADIDEKTGRATAIKRIQYKLNDKA